MGVVIKCVDFINHLSHIIILANIYAKYDVSIAYSSKFYSVTGLDKVTIFSSQIRNIQILDLPKYLVSMAMFVLVNMITNPMNS